MLLTMLFGCLILASAHNRRRMLAVALIGSVAILGIAPPPAQAQCGLLCAIQTVLNTINHFINDWLGKILGVFTSIYKYYTKVVWDVDKINAAKAQIAAMIARVQAVFAIFNTNPHTATLPATAALENILRNRSVADFGQMPQIFGNTYGSVPSAGIMSPADRNMTDMDDTIARDNILLAKAADQAEGMELAAADTVDGLLKNPDFNVSAPGSTALITASAAVAQIKSEAINQMMLAGLLRQEAARIAHDNALRKRGSTLAVQIQQGITNMLQHR